MGFFLLRRDGDAVTLIAPTVYGSRTEALAEVSRASAEGSLDADEVFVIDLDAATPVLIVTPTPAPVPPEDHPQEEPFAEEIALGGEAPDDHADPEVAEAPIVKVEDAIAAAVLADALDELPRVEADEEPLGTELTEREVAESESPPSEPEQPEEAVELEGAEGSGEPEPQFDEPESDEPEADEPLVIEPESDEPEADEPLVIEPESDEPEPEDEGAEDSEDPEAEPIPEPVAQTWPWEPVPVPMETPDTDAEAPAEADEAGQEEAGEDGPREEPFAADDEADDELPEEVSGLLADLEEVAPAPSEADDEEEASESEEAMEPPGPGQDDEAVQPPAASDEPVMDAELLEEPMPPKAYEAGASDITTLTCDDCIYLNTCPKKGESDPTSCGSFQWKSV